MDVTSCVRELISHVAFLCTSPGPGPNMLLSPSYFSTNSPRGYVNFLFVPVLETVHTVNAPSPKNAFVVSSVVVSQTCTYVAVERFPSISALRGTRTRFRFWTHPDAIDRERTCALRTKRAFLSASSRPNTPAQTKRQKNNGRWSSFQCVVVLVCGL